jgi:hypothetical protein
MNLTNGITLERTGGRTNGRCFRYSHIIIDSGNVLYRFRLDWTVKKKHINTHFVFTVVHFPLVFALQI